MTTIKALILDMDGVLWRDTEPIGDLPATLARIEAKGMKVTFATNNATKTVEEYQQKFRGFGVEAKPEQIFTSSKATAHYLKQTYPAGGSVYIVGERGLREAVQQAGFAISDADCIAVAVGLDRQLTYDKLKRATMLIRGGAAFIGANPDPTLPSPDGLVPGAGTILAALRASTGAQPTIIGKPERALVDAAMNAMGVRPEETLMVGDRLDTDVAAGQKAGTLTAVVLSGVTNEQSAREWKPAPDYIERDLASLVDKL
jgi:4-nitrophenyl phosphatase